jgi:hypothetical protein
MADLLGAGGFVHEDDSSALILDREPLRWQDRRRRQRGIGWVEGDARRPPATFTDWQSAAQAGICGLLLDGRRRSLHSAVNGLAPLYWLEHDDAVYFASRIDPLVRSSPLRLSIDWDAWAAILTMRFPPGDRTPFAEISRLPHQSLLRRRFGRAQVREERWPWAEIEPDQSIDRAAEGTAAALEESLAPLTGGIVCPLSGGRDSRILFTTLARGGRVAAAVTVPDDDGEPREEDLAAPVAAAFEVGHERLRGAEADYPSEWEERARRTEYQMVDHAWLMPMARRVAESGAPVPDGFAIDVFASAGRNFFNRETFDMSTPPAASRAMFDSLRQYGHAHLALEERFQEPMVARAREQYLASVKRFEGHPHQIVFDFYVSRSRRGISTYSTKLVGEGAWAITPGADDDFVRAALSIDLEKKRKGELYQGILEILAPEVAALPSTADVPRGEPRLPRRWCSPTAVRAHRRSLRDGPLAPHLSPELQAWVEGPVEAEPNGHLRVGIESVSLMHSWWRRYRDHLQEVDPLELRL